MFPMLALVDRKSTRLNSSHLVISYAVFCLKKKINENVVLSMDPALVLEFDVLRRQARAARAQLFHRRRLPLYRSRDISLFLFFFFNDTATTEIYPLSLHDALPI